MTAHTVPLTAFSRVDAKTLVAQASDLGPASSGTPWLRPLLSGQPDSPMGIFIRSGHTGTVVRFQLVKTVRDRENDLTSWEFVVFPPDAALSRSVSSVTVFND